MNSNFSGSILYFSPGNMCPFSSLGTQTFIFFIWGLLNFISSNSHPRYFCYCLYILNIYLLWNNAIGYNPPVRFRTSLSICAFNLRNSFLFIVVIMINIQDWYYIYNLHPEPLWLFLFWKAGYTGPTMLLNFSPVGFHFDITNIHLSSKLT